MIVRAAQLEDAEEACAVLRQSITALCEADHHNDAAILAPWLANKTPDNVRAWISAPRSHVFVASDGQALLGIGAITSDGQVTLNYVAPEARFRGVSKAILARLETKAAELGLATIRLESSKTAHAFYQSQGYEDVASSEDRRPTRGILMAKCL